MADHFALLNEPRRPWLDAEALKEKFHTLTAAQHPDVNAAGDFAAINNAYQILSDPVKRLRHFLELEFPSARQLPTQVPSQLAELFMQVGATRQAAETFLKRQTQVGSPLAQALLASERSSVLSQLESIRAVLDRHRDQLDEELKNFGEKLDATRLAQILAELSFVSKWSEQLREMIFQFAS